MAVADRVGRSRVGLRREVRNRRRVVRDQAADQPEAHSPAVVHREEHSRVAGLHREALRADGSQAADRQEVDHQAADRQEVRNRDLDRQAEVPLERRGACRREDPNHREVNRAEVPHQADRSRREVHRGADHNRRHQEVRREADPIRRLGGHHHRAGNRRRPLRARSRSAWGQVSSWVVLTKLGRLPRAIQTNPWAAIG